MNHFPSNNMSFVAGAALTGEVEIVRTGEFQFNLYPADKAIKLWNDFLGDRLVYSARLLAEQIRELKRAPVELPSSGGSTG